MFGAAELRAGGCEMPSLDVVSFLCLCGFRGEGKGAFLSDDLCPVLVTILSFSSLQAAAGLLAIHVNLPVSWSLLLCAPSFACAPAQNQNVGLNLQ